MANLLVILAKTIGKPKWLSVASILHSHLPYLNNILVYTWRDGGSEGRTHFGTVLLCSYSEELSGISVTFSGISQDFNAELVTATPELRLYKPFAEPLGVSTLIPEQTNLLSENHIMVSVALTPFFSAEKSFNDWYQDEHIPLLQQVPTWLSSERFILVYSTNEAVPKYLALHRWNNEEAFSTEEYNAATNTQWRTTVMSEIEQKERSVLTYEGNLPIFSHNAVLT